MPGTTVPDGALCRSDSPALWSPWSVDVRWSNRDVGGVGPATESHDCIVRRVGDAAPICPLIPRFGP
jgi:hypothetical protein